MTQVACSPASYERMFPIVPSAMGHSRPARLPTPLATPDTPGLTSSSSSGLFSAVSSRLESSFFAVSPLSPMVQIPDAEQKDHFSVWEPSFSRAPLFHLGVSIHQHHVGDHGDGSNNIYNMPLTVPPNSPSGNFPSTDNSSFLHRRHKPLPFFATFMESGQLMGLLEQDELQDILRDGPRPLAPVKSAFGEDGLEAPWASEPWLDSCELQVSSLTREERSRRVQSLRLQPLLDSPDGFTPFSPVPTLSSAPSKIASLPRLNTDLGSATKPSFHFLLSDDESLRSARLQGAITLTLSSPIYSAHSPSGHLRRWSIGSDQDDSDVKSPRSALLSPLTAATSHNFSSFMDTPSPSPFSSRPLRPSLPSLSDPALVMTFQSARDAMLACREMARSERHHLASMRAFLDHEEQVPYLPTSLIRQHAPSLIEASEVFLAAMRRDSSPLGVATAFLANEALIQSAFIEWSRAIQDLELTVIQAKTMRDVIEPPIDRVAKYIFLFQDILSHSTSSPSYPVVHAAFQSAKQLAIAVNAFSGVLVPCT